MPKRTEHRTPTLPLDDLHEPAAPPEPVAPAAAVVPPAPAAQESEDSIARFEQDMKELEDIVQQMERGELRLEDSLQMFERGMALSRSCRRSLDLAELKVRTLSENDPDVTDA